MANNDNISDFSSLLAARKQRQDSIPTDSSTPTPEQPTPIETDQSDSSTISQEQPTTKKVGRPRGRRSNPEVAPLNLLINEDLVLEVRFKLGKQNKGKTPKKTISDLVEELLSEWVKDD